MSLDSYGATVAAVKPGSVASWNDAWVEALHFVGDPFATLSDANQNDEDFALGSVFCGTYRLLGGAPFDAPEVLADLTRANQRAQTPRELAHVEALQKLAAGNFTAAANRWDEAATAATDLAAVRFAHDVYLHVGDAESRLRSSSAAFTKWPRNDHGWNFIAGQHSFALEETGQYAEAEVLGWEALEADPLDLWALHSLAHVYESTNNQTAALDLLRSRQATWRLQDSLAVHIWWHLALRLIAGGDLDEALELHDQLVPDATTPFRLCDLASLLWRLELVGLDVGDRWEYLADEFAARPERHTSGFVDLHMALVYARRPKHVEAARFFAGVPISHAAGSSENDDIFRTVVTPLVAAIQHREAAPSQTMRALDQLDAQLHRIGGSIAQRQIVNLTRTALEA